jgi:hypothetical protein
MPELLNPGSKELGVVLVLCRRPWNADISIKAIEGPGDKEILAEFFGVSCSL